MALRNQKDLDGMFIWFSGEESFETNLIVVSFCFCQNAVIDLLLMNLDVVLQLGKIVASVEQKPVSLHDIVTCGTPIKNESDYWMSSRHWL